MVAAILTDSSKRDIHSGAAALPERQLVALGPSSRESAVNTSLAPIPQVKNLAQ